MMMMMVLAIGGAFLFLGKKKEEPEPLPPAPSGPTTISEQQQLAEFQSDMERRYSQGLTQAGGLGMIGSLDYDAAENYIPTGVCNCDSEKCCYEEAVQMRTDVQVIRRCKEILYGDIVGACTGAYDKFAQDSWLDSSPGRAEPVDYDFPDWHRPWRPTRKVHFKARPSTVRAVAIAIAGGGGSASSSISMSSRARAKLAHVRLAKMGIF